jgi:hypothetical protein
MVSVSHKNCLNWDSCGVEQSYIEVYGGVKKYGRIMHYNYHYPFRKSDSKFEELVSFFSVLIAKWNIQVQGWLLWGAC